MVESRQENPTSCNDVHKTLKEIERHLEHIRAWSQLKTIETLWHVVLRSLTFFPIIFAWKLENVTWLNFKHKTDSKALCVSQNLE